MVDIDRAIREAEEDVSHLQVSKANTTKRFPVTSVLLLLLAGVVYVLMDEVSGWIFGLPEETVQADVVKLLHYTDGKIQRSSLGDQTYPLILPDDTSSQIVNYKRTLAGYKLDAKIHDVHMMLVRQGETVRVSRRE